MANITVKADSLQEQIDKLDELLTKLSLVEDKTKALTFITIPELAKITGWSRKIVNDLYNRKDFPSCDFGKQKIAELNAVREYFSVPRRK